jgi:hypothetical protein
MSGGGNLGGLFAIVLAVVVAGLSTVIGILLIAKAFFPPFHSNPHTTTLLVWGLVLLIPVFLSVLSLLWSLTRRSILRLGRKPNA